MQCGDNTSALGKCWSTNHIGWQRQRHDARSAASDFPRAAGTTRDGESTSIRSCCSCTATCRMQHFDLALHSLLTSVVPDLKQILWKMPPHQQTTTRTQYTHDWDSCEAGLGRILALIRGDIGQTIICHPHKTVVSSLLFVCASKLTYPLPGVVAKDYPSASPRCLHRHMSITC